MDDIFDKAIKKIENAYEKQGYGLGWCFLHSSKKTLTSSTKLMFVGINPGGGGSSTPIPSLPPSQFIQASCEEGNAYRVKDWGETGRQHQNEVQKMFRRLSSVGIGTSWEDLMDNTLTSNFCPFRSPGGGWTRQDRDDKKEAVQFSYELWSDILPHLEPKVIICDGNGGDSAFGYFTELFGRLDFDVRRKGDFPFSYEGERRSIKKNYLYGHSNKFVDIIGLPHLSWNQIFTRKGYEDPIGSFLNEVKRKLNGI